MKKEKNIRNIYPFTDINTSIKLRYIDACNIIARNQAFKSYPQEVVFAVYDLFLIVKEQFRCDLNDNKLFEKYESIFTKKKSLDVEGSIKVFNVLSEWLFKNLIIEVKKHE